MLVLLSPAKTLDFESPLPRPARSREFTQPELLQEADQLVHTLRQLTPENLQELMDISPALAELNVQRYANWQLPFSTENARPALFAFTGDVYMGLDAPSLNARDINYAQQHIRILSGLYGLLRPLDLMQPYRLEMGTQLRHKQARSLYQYWGDLLACKLDDELAQHKSREIINLASVEYFSAVRQNVLDARVVSPVFKDYKNGQYKIISFFAKKARGAMAGFIVRQRIRSAKGLLAFAEDGYAYSEAESTPEQPVFLRRTT